MAKLNLQKMAAVVTVELNNGYLKLEFPCPRAGESIESASQELAKCFAGMFGGVLGLADQGDKIAELEKQLIETKANLETAKAKPVPQAAASAPITGTALDESKHGVHRRRRE